MTDTPAPGQTYARFAVRQKLTLMVNRYEVIELDDAGKDVGFLALAEQKRLKIKEEVTFFADESKKQPLFGFKARKRLELAAGYDITDGTGAPIGWFKKEFKASLLTSTWRLGTPDGFECKGQERNTKVAIARRLWDFVPVVGEMGSPFLFHFDFVAPDGHPVMSSVKKMGIKDRYVIDVPARPDGTRLDWRVAACMAVALDALQSR